MSKDDNKAMAIKKARDMVNQCYFMCDYVAERIVGPMGAGLTGNRSVLYRSLQLDTFKFLAYCFSDEEDGILKNIDDINEILNTSYTGMMMKYAQSEAAAWGKDIPVPSAFKSFLIDDIRGDPKYNNKKALFLFATLQNIGRTMANDNKSRRKAEMFLKAVADYGNKYSSFEFYSLKQYEEELADIALEEETYCQEKRTPAVEEVDATSAPKTESADDNPNIVVQEAVVDDATLEDLMEELNALTGLDGVKKEISSLTNLIKINKLREEKGLKPSNVSKHMVFAGNPGTGKTTVARLLSRIYAKLGVLSKGQLVETDRSGLVAGYVGQTAIKSQDVIKKAIGGVLFIDEAYTLSANKGESDFGQEAIDTLLKMMEDNRDDLVVVVAGYPDLMDQFLSSNPGLKSRFNKFINFEDYTSEELMAILEGMLEKQEFEVSEDDKPAIQEKLEEMVLDKDENFANARSVRNLLEHAIRKQAERLVSLEDIGVEELKTLTKEDFDIISESTDSENDGVDESKQTDEAAAEEESAAEENERTDNEND